MATKTMPLPGRAPSWRETGIFLKTGERATISAEGSISFGPWGSWVFTPEGELDRLAGSGAPAPGEIANSLVARAGFTARYIGAKGEIVCERDSQLLIAANDDWARDNGGHWTVTIETDSTPAAAASPSEKPPQIQPFNPTDPTFLEWAAQQRAPQTPFLIPREPGEPGEPGQPRPPAGVQLSSFHAYSNWRPGVDWNTCGQAAIASITDFHGLNPYNLPRSGPYWDDGQAIDAIKAGGFGPDVVFGWGTTGGRIRDALRSYGLKAEVGHSGFLFFGWEDQLKALRRSLSQRLPVPVLVDLGMLGGSAFSAHWPIAWKMEGGRVYLAACPNPQPTEREFIDAWAARHLPYGFNHCGVYASR
jgi:hypothetical protein